LAQADRPRSTAAVAHAHPPVTSGTAAWQVPSAPTLGTAEQVTLGAVLSVTVKLVAQVALLPAASVAVTVMVCVPTATSVPAAGDWLKLIAPGPLQPSLTLTPPVTSGTAPGRSHRR